MVKNLLSEQAQLKDQLAAQSQELTTFKESKNQKPPAIAQKRRDTETKSTRVRPGLSAQPKNQ